MAPPSSTLPLGERLKALAQTLQYGPLDSTVIFIDADGAVTAGSPGLLGMSTVLPSARIDPNMRTILQLRLND